MWPARLYDVDIRSVSIGGPGQGGEGWEGGLEQVQHEYNHRQAEEEEEWDDEGEKVKTMHWRRWWRKKLVLHLQSPWLSPKVNERFVLYQISTISHIFRSRPADLNSHHWQDEASNHSKNKSWSCDTKYEQDSGLKCSAWEVFYLDQGNLEIFALVWW